MDDYDSLVSSFRSISLMIIRSRAIASPEVYRSLWNYADHLMRRFNELRLNDLVSVN